MLPHRYVTVVLELDRCGGPERGSLFVSDDQDVVLAVRRIEFAPFDSLLDVGRWITREVRSVVPVRPGG